MDDKRINGAITKWRMILLMEDWDIEWRFDDSVGVDGQVHAYPNDHQIKIVFKPLVREYKDEELERLVAHELLHAVLQPISDYFGPWVDGHLPDSIQCAFWRSYNDTIENRVVEDLLRILRAK